jgi:hypothetical protein
MAKYIECEAVKKSISECCGDFTEKDAEYIIENVPENDVVEVKHGHWIKTDELVGIEFLKCSVCGETHPRMRTKYCCDCGAKMDLKEGADDGC